MMEGFLVALTLLRALGGGLGAGGFFNFYSKDHNC
jgi:uncharacterized membrane protein